MLRNITLSAESTLIRKAREKASRENATLNSIFRHWLRRYVNADKKIADFDSLMEALQYAHPGKTFRRDEMNER